MMKHAIFLSLLLLVGCSAEDDLDVSSKTMALRQSTSPIAKQYFIKAQKAVEQQAFANALVWADSAEKYAPELADIPYLKGRIYTALHHSREAFTNFLRTSQLDARYAGVWFQLGNNAFGRQQYAEAITWYEKELALARSKKSTFAKLANRRRVCQTLLQIARCHSNQGAINLAEQACLKAVAEDSTFASAYGDLAYYQKFRGDQSAAMQSISKALTLQPSNSDYLYTFGLLQLQTGQVEGAVQTFQKIIRSGRNFDDKVYYNLGLALNQTGRLAEGERLLRAVDSLHTHQGKIFQARYRVDLSPEMPGPWMHLAEAYAQAGQLSQAIAAMRHAFNLDPENTKIRQALHALEHKK